MQTAQPNIFTRDDTFFGVCEALGEDLGFHPNILRVILPVLLFLYPVPTIAGYAAAGAVVGLSRWLFPAPSVAVAAQEAVEIDAATEEQMELLPLAA